MRIESKKLTSSIIEHLRREIRKIIVIIMDEDFSGIRVKDLNIESDGL